MLIQIATLFEMLGLMMIKVGKDGRGNVIRDRERKSRIRDETSGLETSSIVERRERC